MHKVVIYTILGLFFCPAIPARAQEILPAVQNGKWGYINQQGKVVVPFRFDKASTIVDGVGRAISGNNLYLIMGSEKIIELPGCSRYARLSNGCFKVLRDNKWWLTDSSGNFLSKKGYDRIWNNYQNSQRFFVSELGKLGLIDHEGNEMIIPKFFKLLPLSNTLYQAVNGNLTINLIQENGKLLFKDSFKSVALMGQIDNLILVETTDKKKILYTSEGEQIIADHKLEINYIGNQFYKVSKNDHTFLYDGLRKVFIDTLKGEFAPSAFPNSIAIFLKGESQLFDRYNGTIQNANNINIVRVGNDIIPYIVSRNGFLGLMSSKNQIILEPIYGQIELLDNKRFKILDTNFSYAIYNFVSQKWEHKGLYTDILAGDKYLKAYGVGNFMDHYSLDDSGNIIEINTYFNVIHVNAYYRSSFYDNWNSPNSNTFTPNRTRGNAGWYGTFLSSDRNNRFQVYGLRKLDSATKKFKYLIAPSYTYVRVLQTPGLSIAGLVNNLKGSDIVVVGDRRTARPLNNYVLVNDNTGRKLTPLLEFIDAEECENDAVGSFRAFHLGKTQIISKSNLKPIFNCLYASQERNGARRIYVGGKFKIDNRSALRNQIIEDPNFFSDLGLTRLAARSRFGGSAFSVEGGQWLILLKNGSVIKPKIAGENTVVAMGEFNMGKSIVTLSNGKCGVIDTAGNTWIAAEYDYIKSTYEIPGFFYCGKYSYKYGIANKYGDIEMAPQYKQLFNRGSAFYGKNNDTGYVFQLNKPATMLIKQDVPFEFEKGTGFIKTKKGYTLTQENGAEITDISFSKAMQFNNGYAPVFKGRGWGLIDANGNTIIENKYAKARTFGFTTGVFEHHNHWYFIDLNGNKIKRPKGAEAVQEIMDGLFVYSKKDRYGLYNAEGKKISSFKFNQVPFVHNNYIIGTRASKIYFFDLDGNKLGIMPGVAKGGNKQITHQTGGKIRSKEYKNQYVLGFSTGQMRAFGLDTPWRELQLPMAFHINVNLQKTQLFEAYLNDVFLIGSGESYSFVNANNEPLNFSNFSYAEPMTNGLSICKGQNGQFGVMDKFGFWTLQPQYADIKRLNDDYFSYRVAYEFDIFDSTGNKILDQPVHFYEYKNGVLKLQNGNKMGYYSPENGMVWELQE